MRDAQTQRPGDSYNPGINNLGISGDNRFSNFILPRSGEPREENGRSDLPTSVALFPRGEGRRVAEKNHVAKFAHAQSAL
jgi:hypothetical protein